MFLQNGVYLPMSLHGAKDGEGMFLQNVLYLPTSLRVAEHGDSKFLRNGAEDGKTVCSSKTMTSIYESAKRHNPEQYCYLTPCPQNPATGAYAEPDTSSPLMLASQMRRAGVHCSNQKFCTG
jgi:hypothetical protein